MSTETVKVAWHDGTTRILPEDAWVLQRDDVVSRARDVAKACTECGDHIGYALLEATPNENRGPAASGLVSVCWQDRHGDRAGLTLPAHQAVRTHRGRVTTASEAAADFLVIVAVLGDVPEPQVAGIDPDLFTDWTLCKVQRENGHREWLRVKGHRYRDESGQRHPLPWTWVIKRVMPSPEYVEALEKQLDDLSAPPTFLHESQTHP